MEILASLGGMEGGDSHWDEDEAPAFYGGWVLLVENNMSLGEYAKFILPLSVHCHFLLHLSLSLVLLSYLLWE